MRRNLKQKLAALMAGILALSAQTLPAFAQGEIVEEGEGWVEEVGIPQGQTGQQPTRQETVENVWGGE